MMPTIDCLHAENERLARHLWQWQQGSIGFRIRSEISGCAAPEKDPLTKRERAILEDFKSGLTNQQVAFKHGISVSHAKDCRSEIKYKLGLSELFFGEKYKSRRRPNNRFKVKFA